MTEKKKAKKRKKLNREKLDKIIMLATLGTPKKCFVHGNIYEIGKDLSEETARAWIRSGSAALFKLVPVAEGEPGSAETLDEISASYEKLQKEVEKLHPKRLQRELQSKTQAQPNLEQEALKAMVLEDKEKQLKLEKKAKENAEEIKALKGKQAFNKEAIEALRASQKELAEKAREEIYKLYCNEFNEATRKLIEGAEKLLVHEEEMIRIADEANDLAKKFMKHKGAVGYISAHQVFMPLTLLTTRKPGERGDISPSPMMNFLSAIKGRGI